MGPAPDFLMTHGKIAVYHLASIQMTTAAGYKQKLNVSHASFYNLAKEIAERSIAFGIRNNIRLNWANKGRIGFQFALPNKVIDIDYRLNPDLSRRDQATLSDRFEWNIQTFLRI
jgi:hypothetical protein